jgi:hypothetical protein
VRGGDEQVAPDADVEVVFVRHPPRGLGQRRFGAERLNQRDGIAGALAPALVAAQQVQRLVGDRAHWSDATAWRLPRTFPPVPSASTPKVVAVTVVLVAGLLLMLAFAGSYVGAFHDPKPHSVPVSIVSSDGQTAARVAAQLNGLPGTPLKAEVAPTRAAAVRDLVERDIYGIYEVDANTLDVAPAAGRTTAAALELVFDRALAQQGRPAVTVRDLRPLPASDPNGLAVFYVVIAWVFGGYLGATLLGLVRESRSRTRELALERLGALAAYAVIGSGLSILLLHAAFGVLGGSWLGLWGAGALIIFAAGAATTGLQAALGMIGTGIAIVLFVIIGNAASGGPYSRPLLPGFWATIGGILPPGAGVDLTRNILFFDGHRTLGPILVLVAWAAIGAAVALALGGRVTDEATAEAEASAAAAL